MPTVKDGLAQMIAGSATAQTALNQTPGDDAYRDLITLQDLTTQLLAMSKKYGD